MKILALFGTRPEAVKLAPVIRLMRADERFEPTVCVTAQHRELLDPALAFFGIRPEIDLDLMRPEQSLSDLSAAVLRGLEPVLAETRPDWVLVQGDTTTTLMAALAAFYAGAPVAHLEAGLRTGDKRAPFPEEINRRLASHVADLHLAPTAAARQALLHEGIADDRILVSGNTVIDALLWARERVRADEALVDASVSQRFGDTSRRMVLVTAHRRESFGAGMRAICEAVRALAEAHPAVDFVWPVHLNPHVRRAVEDVLVPSARANVVLLDPVDYPTFVWLLDRCHLVLTDSGGVQEEAPALGKPVLVMRATTERPEGVAAGVARLVGTDRARIVRETETLLADQDAYRRMNRAVNPYGDGRAAGRVLAALCDFDHQSGSQTRAP